MELHLPGRAESSAILVLVTTSSKDEAELIAHVLLERRKAACVNICDGISSKFWWQGKIETASESLMLIKTSITILEDVIALVESVHSYEVPEIIALPILGGSEAYLAWVSEEVSASED